MHFADDLIENIKRTSSIVVGIDPNFDLMPETFWPKYNTKECVKNALVDFTKSIVDASYDLIPAVKFQSAYFEQYGIAGIEALIESVKYARGKNLLVILDAKRGDIGPTSLAYANAYLTGFTQLKNGLKIHSGLEFDCMTVNPFLGGDSICPFIETATEYGKGIFVLVKNSNPGSQMIQDITKNGITVSEGLAELVEKEGMHSIGKSGYSCIGAVVGATFPDEAKKLRTMMPHTIFLVPGVGAQGGTIETALACFDNNGMGAIVSISRDIIYPQKEEVLKENYHLLVKEKILEFRNILDQALIDRR